LTAEEVRSDDAIHQIQVQRGGFWPLVRWVHRRRPILTFAVATSAPLLSIAMGATPTDLIRLEPRGVAVSAWLLMVFGVVIRLWGSGNLRKNQEITDTGIYVMVRHPLYLGSLSLFLAFFLTVGDPLVGLVLFVILVALVYYPTMLSEEEFLTLKFPAQFARYDPPPRLLPDPRRLPKALESDRFDAGAAFHNLGFRSAAVFVILPAFLWTLSRVRMAL
jgi:protein-S-isoprenylcysteine O-methyltransferase Ste14